MRRSARVRAAQLVSIGFTLASFAFAQSATLRSYTEADGLASSAVRDIAQGARGWMWFATRRGLTSFDGHRWTTYGEDRGILSEDLGGVACDDRGQIWVVTLSMPIRVWRGDGRAFTELPPPPTHAESDDGQQLHGFATWSDPDSARGRGVAFVVDRANVHVWDGTRWRVRPTDGQATGLATRGRELWVSTTAGLFTGDAVGTAPLRRVAEGAVGTRVGDRAMRLRSVAVAPDDRAVYVLAGDWVGRVGDAGFEIVAESAELLEDPGFSRARLIVEERGVLWIGTHDRTFRLDADGAMQPFPREPSPSFGGTRALVRDREGFGWFATDRGVMLSHGPWVRSWDEADGLFATEASAIVFRGARDVLVGHAGGLSAVVGDRLRSIRIPSSPSDARVLDVATDPDGTVWFAARTAGLRTLSVENRWARRHVPDTGIEGVATVHWSPSRRTILVGSRRHVYADRDGQFEPLYEVDDRPSMYLRRIDERRDGTMLLATTVGAVCLFPDGTRSVCRGPDPGSSNVYAFLERPDGELWVGTAGGLCRLADGRLEPIEPGGVRLRRPVYAFVEQLDETCWLGTDRGVGRWDGTSWRWWTRADGLAGDDVSRAALARAADGRIWVGTEGGLSVIDPSDAAAPRPQPSVSIVATLVDGLEVPFGRLTDAGRDVRDLRFQFAVAAFRDPSELLVQTWLEGYEPGWSEAEPLVWPEARYRDLPSGRYRFHVRAGWPGRPWSVSAGTDWIRVSGVFWKRPWFQTLVVAVLLALAFSGWRSVVLRRQARRLEQEVESRLVELRRTEAELAIARRLESLGVLAGGIAHDFNNYLTVVIGNLSLLDQSLRGRVPEDDGVSIAAAYRAALRARSLTKQLMTFARGGGPIRQRHDLAELVRDSMDLVGQGSTCRFELEVEEDLPLVDVDADQLGQVFHNLLLNAIEATNGQGCVRIRIVRPSARPAALPSVPIADWLAVYVTDDGPGIPEELRHRVFDPYFTTKKGGSGLGLASAYSIVTKHGGLMTVEAARAVAADHEPDAPPTGDGTTFAVWLPAAAVGGDEVVGSDEAAGPGEFAARRPVRARVLIMDDDLAVRTTILRQLESGGFGCVAVADGSAAIAAHADARRELRPFDVVLLDLTVRDGVGGAEAARQIRAIDTDVRLVVVSGYSDDPILSRFTEHGFDAAVVKPFGRDQLLDVVANQVRARDVS